MIKVSRTGDVSGSVSVDFATSDLTATAGSDYTAANGTLNFAPGELSKNISIPIVNDNVFENGNETFTLALSNPTSAAILTAPNATTITISDNDFKPTIFVPQAIRVVEGNSGSNNLTVTVRLSNLTIEPVTVDYATANGTAAAGNDYVAASGTVTLPAGSSSVTVNVPITGDTTVEPDENFTITLSNATNVNFISSPVGTVTIANDDANVQINNAAVSVNESAGFATVTVTRVGDTSRVASVEYATTDTAGLQSCTLANSNKYRSVVTTEPQLDVCSLRLVKPRRPSSFPSLTMRSSKATKR